MKKAFFIFRQRQALSVAMSIATHVWKEKGMRGLPTLHSFKESSRKGWNVGEIIRLKFHFESGPNIDVELFNVHGLLYHCDRITKNWTIVRVTVKWGDFNASYENQELEKIKNSDYGWHHPHIIEKIVLNDYGYHIDVEDIDSKLELEGLECSAENRSKKLRALQEKWLEKIKQI